MSAYVVFDVEIRDVGQYQEFMARVKPALEEAGAKYLARGGAHKVYEGDWEPRRIVLLEFPSVTAFEAFYNGPTYQGLKSIRDACSSARLLRFAQAVADRALIIEKGCIRYTSTMAELMANEAVRAQYLSL